MIKALLGAWFMLCCSWAFAQQQNGSTKFVTRTTDNGFFQVVALDYKSSLMVTHMAEVVGNLGARYFKLPHDFGSPILVQLKPQAFVNFEHPYTLDPQVDGELVVNMKWGADTTFEDTCQALASSYLVRIATFNYGKDAAAQVPDWLELAFAHLLQVKLRPAFLDHFHAQAIAGGPIYAKTILNAQAPFDDEGGQIQLGLNAYWLFDYLEHELYSDDFEALLVAFLRGDEPIRLLNRALPEYFASERDIETWWHVGFQYTVRNKKAPFYSLNESYKLIQELSYIDWENEAEEQRLRGNELFVRREEVGLDAVVQTRIREIKLELQKVNPVYFNALLSLGLSYEAVLAGNLESFAENYQTYLNDFSSAERFESAILQLLEY